jgi:polyhydroxybutyrate depolymerase
MTLVFPDAVDGLWRDGRGADDEVDDVGFIDTLLDHFTTHRNIDPGKIFLVGASNGGFLSQRLICELEGRFRAAATVIATMGLRIFQQAYPDKVPSLYLIAGTADPIIPYEGGATPNSLMHSADAPILGFDDLVAHWRDIGGFVRCRRTAGRTVTALDGQRLTIQAEDCRADDGRRLRAVTVEGGGHQWYGREVGEETIRRFGPTTTQFRLSAEILDFFIAAETAR